jgi:hypothetical protein
MADEERGVRPTVCVDWDGTCVEYGGWQNYQPGKHGEWKKGAVEALQRIARCCNLVILTARPEPDWEEIQKRLAVAEVSGRVTNIKPPALAYIDDRAIEFDNWLKTEDTLSEILWWPDDGWAKVDLFGGEGPSEGEEWLARSCERGANVERSM